MPIFRSLACDSSIYQVKKFLKQNQPKHSLLCTFSMKPIENLRKPVGSNALRLNTQTRRTNVETRFLRNQPFHETNKLLWNKSTLAVNVSLLWLWLCFINQANLTLPNLTKLTSLPQAFGGWALYLSPIRFTCDYFHIGANIPVSQRLYY